MKKADYAFHFHQQSVSLVTSQGKNFTRRYYGNYSIVTVIVCFVIFQQCRVDLHVCVVIQLNNSEIRFLVQAQVLRHTEGRRQHQVLYFTFRFSARPYLIKLTLESSQLVEYTWCYLISSVFYLDYINCGFLFLSELNLLVL